MPGTPLQGRIGLGQAQSSARLEGEGTGSPCYEVDENGEDDLTKPKVRKRYNARTRTQEKPDKFRRYLSVEVEMGSCLCDDP